VVRFKTENAARQNNEAAIIKLEDVSTVYESARRTAIKHVNLTVKKNELVYVVGPNAAGKTRKSFFRRAVQQLGP
jgi:ABC-type Mn2+/Zn2+ transport system ATPase subunit